MLDPFKQEVYDKATLLLTALANDYNGVKPCPCGCNLDNYYSIQDEAAGILSFAGAMLGDTFKEELKELFRSKLIRP